MKKIDNYTLGLISIISVHVVILLKSTFFPYPELFIYPYLRNIGLVPYKDILDQHFPGFMFFPINIGNLGFTTPQSMQILEILIVVIIHMLIYKIVSNSFKSKTIALFTNILFFAFQPFLEGNVLWIDNFIPLLLLPAYYLLTEKLNSKKAFLVGLLLGISVLLKQVAIPLVLIITIYIFLYQKKEKIFQSFIAGGVIPALALLLFVVFNNSLDDFIFWAGTFNFTVYAEMGRKYATFRQLLAAGVIYAPAVLIAVWGLTSRSKQLLLLSAFFLTGLLYAYARFDYVHLQPSLPFAILLLAFGFSKIPKSILLKLFIVYLIPVFWVSSKFYISNVGDSVRFFGESEREIASKIVHLTEKNDPIFMYGTLPHMYQLTSTRPSGNIFVFHFPWFMTVAEPRILSGLMADPPKVVVRQNSASMGGESLYSYMQNIEKYVLQNYEKIDQVGDIEILLPAKVQ